MGGWLFPFLTILYAGLLAAALGRLRRRPTLSGGLMAAFFAALATDALVIALGETMGEGDALRGWSWVRLFLRAIGFPLAVLAAFECVRRTGLDWAARRGRFAAGSAALAALGIYPLVASAGLVAERFAGTLRYKPLGIAGPTLAAILAMTLLITFGMILFRRGGPPWPAAAATIMFFGSIFPPSLVGPITASITEAIFAASLLLADIERNEGG